MPDRTPQFAELQRLLLHTGVVAECSQRIVEELQDHYSDLVAEARRGGCDRDEARAHAVRTLGTPADIAAAAAQYRELLTFARRHPLIADVSRSLAGVPALPLGFMVERRETIARWSASVGLAGLITAALLLSLQGVLGSV